MKSRRRLAAGIIILCFVSLAAVWGFPEDSCYIDSASRPVVEYCPASINNYRMELRAPSEIQYIVIHTVQGSMQSAVNTFRSSDLEYPRSAHYTIGSGGKVVKSVDPRYVAWHAGTSPVGSGGKYESRILNENSIGIEHGGFVDDPNFPTQIQYITSAALTRFLCEKFGIPIDRDHIVGHEEIKSAKGDPGPNWDWGYFMDLVRSGSREPAEHPDAAMAHLPEPVHQRPGLLPWVLFVAGFSLSILSLI